MFREVEIFRFFTSEATYREGRIITQKTVSEELDYDPSEGQDWKCEDYEWFVSTWLAVPSQKSDQRQQQDREWQERKSVIKHES